MFKIIPSTDRGFTNLGWLKSYHSFSFGNYYNPDRIAFRSLRVINEDYVAPAKGFDLHSHSNMEILTYVLKGALKHQDSMGNQRILSAGEFQYMSAGSGIAHSEYNASSSEEAHFIQIWITPAQRDLPPCYVERSIAELKDPSGLNLIASRDGGGGAFQIRQNASVFAGNINEGQAITYTINPGRGIWIYQLWGVLNLGPCDLQPGDSACITEEKAIDIVAKSEAKFLLFDLV